MILNVTRVEKHDKYLGLPMEISYSKVEAFGFIKDKIHNKLGGWREKFLSAAGKEVLLKAVIQSIPTYVMSCFELPKHLCHEINQLMARFWWGAKGNEKKIHWEAWDKLCTPKVEGGMGFKSMVPFNLSLLAKQGWRLLNQPDSLVARIFKARYYPNSSFLDAASLPDMSYSWRSILAGRNVLTKGLRFQIGEGRKVSLWNDPWIPLPYSFKPYSTPMDGSENWRVSDIIDHDNHTWLEQVVEDLFNDAEAEIILQLPLSYHTTIDRLIWHFDNKGIYTVKSGYYVAHMTENLEKHASSSAGMSNTGKLLWNKVWKARVPPKVRVFMWRLLRGNLPTRAAIAKKIFIFETSCVF